MGHCEDEVKVVTKEDVSYHSCSHAQQLLGEGDVVPYQRWCEEKVSSTLQPSLRPSPGGIYGIVGAPKECSCSHRMRWNCLSPPHPQD